MGEALWCFKEGDRSSETTTPRVRSPILYTPVRSQAQEQAIFLTADAFVIYRR
jgi:hypothetical protein